MPTLTEPLPETTSSRSIILRKPLPRVGLLTPPHDPALFDAETWFDVRPNPRREIERGRTLAQASLAVFGRAWVHFGLSRPTSERC